ncbi:protein RMD5 homolog [Rutidosis leptorrhynchoides]|uniref:protein RMD5 homolog n=1 Tax=Rutidosis leptorrhynchoides TaxID=125765 RepID=UPI003A9A075F
MELNSIKDAFDGVIKKQTLSSSKCEEVIEQIIQEIEQTLSGLKSSQPDHKIILGELKTKLMEIAPLGQLERTQKELNLVLSKYTKLLEKNFNPDISKSYRNVDFDIHTINQIVASHFYREGMFDVADFFVNEAHEEYIMDSKRHYFEMYEILESMKSRDLGPALKWATTNREKLRENGSDIELKLHRLQFMKILQHGSRDEALKYGQTNFSSFANQHLPEIQKLMTCLLWAGKLESSPYSEFLSPAHWAELAHELAQQFCNLLGESYNSPLRVTIAAGVQALPTLLKLMNVMNGKRHEWQSMKQLPPVDLGIDFQFHSIFVCPVTRDEASEDNPPMLMPCGHVLCKQSITKLSKNNTRLFKCPYCPTDVEVGQCRQLHF